ncbi:MAG: FIST N-terminal domain-containing protein [Phycisphaerae bacterium]|nr:FIST N-terminal domain-containing protein [Phycisphaerae bacterium]
MDRLADRLADDQGAGSAPAGRAGAADLVLLFGSFHHRAAFGDAAAIVSRTLDPRCIIGVTAEWVVGPSHEVEGGPGLSGMALRLPGVTIDPVRFDPFDGPAENWSDDFIRDRLAAGPDAKATFLFADPFSLQTPLLLDRIHRVTAPASLPIIGGLASGSSQPGANVLVPVRTLAASGAVGVTLSGPLQVDSLVSPGCRPVGRTFVVTKGKGNVIDELSGRPALDVAKEIVGALPDGERAAVRDGLLIGMAINEYQERFGRGDFLLRAVLGADTRRNSLFIGDTARIGRTVRFHVRDREAATEDLELLLDREQVRDKPFAVFLTTCSSRGRKLFRAPHVDARAFARRLGNPPLAGFFAAGEIGPVGDRSWLHGHAISAALFRSTPAPDYTTPPPQFPPGSRPG